MQAQLLGQTLFRLHAIARLQGQLVSPKLSPKMTKGSIATRSCLVSRSTSTPLVARGTPLLMTAATNQTNRTRTTRQRPAVGFWAK